MRRHRALARKAWHLHRVAATPLTTGQLRWVYTTLGTHHSADAVFLRNIKNAMTQSVGKGIAPWFCTWCRKDNKGSHTNCGFCGSHWEDCVALQTAPKSPRRKRNASVRQRDWNYVDGWDGDSVPWKASTPRRAQPSPRSAAPKSPARQQPKPKKTSKKQVPPHEPEWVSNAEVANASAMSSSGPLSPEAQQLRELVNSLKKSDIELTPEIQAAISKVAVITPKEATKLMHGAVSKLDHAREKLQKAKTARRNMHRNWSKFLEDAVKRWEQHSERFAKEDADMVSTIEDATSAFQAARTHLEETKEALAEFDNVIENQVQEVSDEELMTDATPSVSTGIKEMLSSLTRLREAQEEPAAKKPRIEESDGPPSTGGASLSKAMQPFGGGGK